MHYTYLGGFSMLYFCTELFCCAPQIRDYININCHICLYIYIYIHIYICIYILYNLDLARPSYNSAMPPHASHVRRQIPGDQRLPVLRWRAEPGGPNVCRQGQVVQAEHSGAVDQWTRGNPVENGANLRKKKWNTLWFLKMGFPHLFVYRAIDLI